MANIINFPSGKVGIGTENPQQTLDIAGTLRLSGSTGTGTTLMARNASGDVSAVTIGAGLNLSNNSLTATGGGTGTVSGSGTATQVAFWGGTTGSTSTALSGSSNLYWDGVNNRLGVGTNTPTRTLDIAGELSVGTAHKWSFSSNIFSPPSTTNGFINLQGGRYLNITNSLFTSGVMSFDNDNRSVFIGNRISIPITEARLVVAGSGITNAGWTAQFHNSGGTSNSLMIRNDGNVAIGNGSPNARLQVHGTDTTDTGWTAQFHNSLGNSNSLMIRNDGNVGIGTSGTTARFVVRASGSSSGSTAMLVQNSGGTAMLTVREDGNVGIGLDTPSNLLEIRGTTANNTASSFRIRNSTPTTLFEVRNDGVIFIGPWTLWYPYNISTGVAIPVPSGKLMRISYGAVGPNENGYGLFVSNAQITNRDYTSGEGGGMRLAEGYAPPSGTGTYNSFYITPTIIQTGSTTGITRAIYVNPSLTSAFDWRSIQWDNSSGFGLYGAGTATNYLNGNLGIKTTTPAQTLDVAGTMRLTGSTGTGTTLMARNASGDVSAVTVGSGLNLSNNTLTATGGGSGTVSGSGTATQVAFWDNTTSLAGNSNLYWDNVNSRLGVGITTPTSNLDVVGSVEFQNPTTDYDGGVLGSELLTTGTGTNWTGTSFATGYLHATGSTVALVSSASISSGQFYQVVVTVSGRTTGSITFSIGGYTSSSISTNTTTTVGPLTTSTDSFTVTPTTDFNGTVSASVKLITAGSASFVGKNSVGTTVYEERISNLNSNIFQGIDAGKLNTTGYSNVFQGFNAGASNTTGFYNVFQGAYAGASNTVGYYNLFQGYDAGRSNTTGFYNVFQGTSAGRSNTSGYLNIFQGADAGRLNTSGYGNIFNGSSSGYSNTTGYYNIFIGTSAGYSNTIGTGNVFQGVNAGISNTTSNNNIFQGLNSGYNNTTGGNNLFLGTNVAFSNIIGSNNVAIGHQAGRYISTEVTGNIRLINSILIGYDSRALASGQTNQVVIGYEGRGLGSNTTVIGNTGTTQTHLHGSLTLGSTNAPTARMVVVGSGSSDTGWTAQFHNVLGNSNSLMIRDDGNVGIGTNAPSARLQINAFGTGSTASAFLIQNSASTSVFSVRDNGDIYGTNTLTLSATKPSINIVGSGISNLDSWGINFNYGVSNKFVILYSEYDKQIFFKGASSNASLILNQDNSNVGINIPAGSLVRSQFVVAGNSYIASGDGIANARLHVLGSGTTNTGWTAQFHNSGGTNNSLMIRNDGNVGVGTDAPAQTLHVAGTMRLTGSTGTGTTLMARNANGDVSAVTLSGGLSLSNNVLSGGSSITPKAETPTGLVNGSNLVYTITTTPIANEGVIVFLNGIAQYNGIDYTVSGTTITFTNAPASGSSIFVYYFA